AATADHDHGVLLQVVALTRDVADHLETIGQAHLGNLAQRRVRLLGRGCIHARADPPLLRAALHVARLFAVDLLRPRLARELLYRRHAPSFTLQRAGRPGFLAPMNPWPRRVHCRPSAPTANRSAASARAVPWTWPEMSS